MLGIGDYLKDEFARRIERPRDEDDKIFHLLVSVATVTGR
jgi:hypothetical protein